MKKAKKAAKDDLRAEYSQADFAEAPVRGKYAKRLRDSSNVVVLTPEVAAVFRNEKAVNKALKSLIDVARAATRS